METTGQRGLESIWLWLEESQKAAERPKPDFGAQLITRRLQVQVLSPQPKHHRFYSKTVVFPLKKLQVIFRDAYLMLIFIFSPDR